MHRDGWFGIPTNKLAALQIEEVAPLVDDFAVTLHAVSVLLAAVDRALAGRAGLRGLGYGFGFWCRGWDGGGQGGAEEDGNAEELHGC